MKRNYTTSQANHHAALLRLAAPKNKKSGVQIWRALRKVECTLSSVAAAICSRPMPEDAWENAARKAEAAIVRALGRLPDGLRFNGDPRGYALKIDVQAGGFIPEGMHRDWGGYGILAPVID